MCTSQQELKRTFQRLANPNAIAPQHAERHAESMLKPYRPSKTPLYTARRLLSLPPGSTAQSLEHSSLQTLFNFSRIYFSLFKHLQAICRSGHHFSPTMTKQIFLFSHYFQAFPVTSQTAGVLWVPRLLLHISYTSGSLYLFVDLSFLQLVYFVPLQRAIIIQFSKRSGKERRDVSFFWFLMVVTQWLLHSNQRTCLSR